MSLAQSCCGHRDWCSVEFRVGTSRPDHGVYEYVNGLVDSSLLTSHGLSASRYGLVSSFTLEIVSASVKLVMMQQPCLITASTMSFGLEQSKRQIAGCLMLSILASK